MAALAMQNQKRAEDEAHVAGTQRKLATEKASEAEQSRAIANRRFNDTREIIVNGLFEIDIAIQQLAGATPVRRMIAEKGLTYLRRLSVD